MIIRAIITKIFLENHYESFYISLSDLKKLIMRNDHYPEFPSDHCNIRQKKMGTESSQRKLKKIERFTRILK